MYCLKVSTPIIIIIMTVRKGYKLIIIIIIIVIQIKFHYHHHQYLLLPLLPLLLLLLLLVQFIHSVSAQPPLFVVVTR